MSDKLTEEDRLNLELHKASLREAASAQREAAANAKLAQSEYKTFLTTIWTKYTLGPNDAIQPDGSIVRSTKEEEKQ